MKTLSPVQSLVFLVLLGLAIGGWCYGVHWKRVASGDLFTSDETMMIRLQDQINTLSQENASLHARLGETPASTTTVPEETTADLPGNGPLLPEGPQKIETH